MADHSTNKSEGRSESKSPIFGAFRKIVNAVEDVVDNVVERGEGMERDTRKMVQNLVKERENKEEAKAKSHEHN